MRTVACVAEKRFRKPLGALSRTLVMSGTISTRYRSFRCCNRSQSLLSYRGSWLVSGLMPKPAKTATTATNLASLSNRSSPFCVRPFLLSLSHSRSMDGTTANAIIVWTRTHAVQTTTKNLFRLSKTASFHIIRWRIKKRSRNPLS